MTLLPPSCRQRNFHFVGIGGIGMSGIAELLHQDGYTVSGSDVSRGAEVRRLEELGVRVAIGHRAENLQNAEAVVFSSAIPPSNPELESARSRRLPLLHRAEMLAEMMRCRSGIAVSGTHGKTTTTAMIASILVKSGLDPTVVVGARVSGLGGNARFGSGNVIVVEADESDRSFLRLPKVCAVVTNIDQDHMDTYRDLQDLRESFERFINEMPFYGQVVACRDDAETAGIINDCSRPVLTYGLEPGADFSAQELRLEAGGASYQCCRNRQPIGQVQLGVAGEHNALNSLAAVAVASWLDIPFDQTQAALADFRGAERRLQAKGEKNGVRIIDDYAHHPTEIEATLKACTALGGRLLVIFQPHRYSRTAHLMGKMNTCFRLADRLYLMEIYPAGETALEGVTGQLLAQEIGASRQVEFHADRKALLGAVVREARPGDILLTLGAGDVWKLGEEFIELH